jgi:hypothetical protein
MVSSHHQYFQLPIIHKYSHNHAVFKVLLRGCRSLLGTFKTNVKHKKSPLGTFSSRVFGLIEDMEKDKINLNLEFLKKGYFRLSRKSRKLTFWSATLFPDAIGIWKIFTLQYKIKLST